MKIRVVKTASKASAVQVVRYQNGKRIIVQHIGSAHNDAELEELMIVAQEWVKDYSRSCPYCPKYLGLGFPSLPYPHLVGEATLPAVQSLPTSH
jgi:hypothetical protein